MKKATFENNGKIISMGQGNLDFYKSTPDFREKVQLFADGINKMNDKVLQLTDDKKALEKALEVYQKSLYVDGSEVDKRQGEIDAISEAITNIRAEILAKMPTYDTADHNLFLAYRSYITGEENPMGTNTYKRAFMEWFDGVGIVPTEKGIGYVMSQMGAKKLSGKAIVKNGGTAFTTNMSEKQYLDILYRTIATMMYKVGALKEYTYEYKLPTKSSK